MRRSKRCGDYRQNYLGVMAPSRSHVTAPKSLCAVTRPILAVEPIHVDSARVTLNVALSDEASCDGGELLALHEDGLHFLVRGEGDATVHSSTLLHAVRRLASGARYSLIIFIGEAERRLPPELRFDEATRAAEAAALTTLMGSTVLASAAMATLGAAPFDALREQYNALRAAGVVGVAIERAVQRYAAPHLRPSSILERVQSGQASAGCWSLRALLRYAHEELGTSLCGGDAVEEDATGGAGEQYMVKETAHAGRAVFAARRLAAGSVLIHETPLRAAGVRELERIASECGALDNLCGEGPTSASLRITLRTSRMTSASSSVAFPCSTTRAGRARRSVLRRSRAPSGVRRRAAGPRVSCSHATWRRVRRSRSATVAPSSLHHDRSGRRRSMRAGALRAIASAAAKGRSRRRRRACGRSSKLRLRLPMMQSPVGLRATRISPRCNGKRWPSSRRSCHASSSARGSATTRRTLSKSAYRFLMMVRAVGPADGMVYAASLFVAGCVLGRGSFISFMFHYTPYYDTESPAPVSSPLRYITIAATPCRCRPSPSRSTRTHCPHATAERRLCPTHRYNRIAGVRADPARAHLYLCPYIRASRFVCTRRGAAACRVAYMSHSATSHSL